METKRRGRRPTKSARGVYVPMTRDRLRRVDRYRATLDKSRGGAVAAIIDTLGEDLATAAQRQAAADGADAQSLRETVQPLVDAVDRLTEAINARALQRQHIGVHSNQIAKLANTARLWGDPALAEDIGAACRGVDRRVEEQHVAEESDDELRHRVQRLLDELAGRSDG